MSRFYDEQLEEHFWRIFGFSSHHYGATPPPPRGPKNAVRPPWAPTEPEPFEVSPAVLPGLVDLAELAGMVVEIQ